MLKTTTDARCKQCDGPLKGKQTLFCCRKHNTAWKNSERRALGYFHTQYRHRVAAGYYYDECPNCGQPKSIKAARCVQCFRTYQRSERGRFIASGKAKSARAHIAHPRPLVIIEPRCPNCDADMRAVEWHSKTVYHCTGCGLETTMDELKRIAVETIRAESAGKRAA